MESIQETMQFRLSQSMDKLQLAAIFLEQGKYCESILESYRAIFYSIRVLLIEKEIDSDDPDKIIEIFEKNFDAALLRNTEIIETAKRSKKMKEYVSSSDVHIRFDEADAMLHNAARIVDDIQKYCRS